MRYDWGFGRYDREVFTAGPRHDRGFTAGNRYDREMYDAPYRREGMGARPMMPRYDQMFRGPMRGERPLDPRRGRDAGWIGWRDGARTAFGAGAHPSDNQHVAPGETDFLGRPYPRDAGRDVPWGLIDQERAQDRMESRMQRGYDRPFRGYDRMYRRDRW